MNASIAASLTFVQVPPVSSLLNRPAPPAFANSLPGTLGSEAKLESAFESFETGLRLNIDPKGELEEMLFKRILECGWNLERCRLAQAQLFEQTPIDPLLAEQPDARFARIEKYARQYENSMYKALRELGKLQTETQYRREVHPLEQEEIDDPELLQQTPQGLPSTCNFQKVHAAVKKANFQNKANSKSNALQLLELFAAPPPVRRELLNKYAAEAA